MQNTPTSSRSEKILIIESDGSFGEQVADALRGEGYAVTLVKNGPEGLKSIYDTLPHLVLLDVSLAGADSYEILRAKAAEHLLAKIPVFLLSSQAVPIDMRRVPEGSVAEYFTTMHIRPPDILERVDRHFGHSKLIRDREAAASPSSVPGASAKPIPRLLWVEDDRLIGTILSKKLSSSGFELYHAVNGEQALDMLRQIIPDVIVLDLVLPGMSGFDILQAIKKDARMAKVPIMILTNLSKQSDIEQATMLGAQRFLVKASSSLDEIVREVRGLLHS